MLKNICTNFCSTPIIYLFEFNTSNETWHKHFFQQQLLSTISIYEAKPSLIIQHKYTTILLFAKFIENKFSQ